MRRQELKLFQAGESKRKDITVACSVVSLIFSIYLNNQYRFLFCFVFLLNDQFQNLSYKTSNSFRPFRALSAIKVTDIKVIQNTTASIDKMIDVKGQGHTHTAAGLWTGNH